MISCAAIAGLPHLDELELSDVDLDPPAAEKPWATSHLRRLTITGSHIDDTGLKCLQGLHKIESLDLTGNLISGEGLGYLEKLPKLSSLTLVYCPITDAGAEKLCRLRQVTNLSLLADEFGSIPRFSEKSIQSLRKAFPNCRDLDNWMPPEEPPPLLPSSGPRDRTQNSNQLDDKNVH